MKNFRGKGESLQFLRANDFPTKDFLYISESNTKNCDQLLALISDKFKLSKATRYAVRSSANVEDGHTQSYAGIFTTELNVNYDNLSAAVQRVVASGKTQSTSIYESGPETTRLIRVSVVIQEMVNSTISGVAFSRSPKAPTSETLIEWDNGYGDRVVEGKGDIKQIYVDAFGSIIENDGKLSSSLIQEIVSAVKKMEKILQFPVDVEWSFDGSQLYFLQVRPITRKFNPVTFLTDANLVESYPGWNSPLTCDLTKKLYYNVFRDGARFLEAGPLRTGHLSSFYQSLIYEWNGHLYYNISSYREALIGMPGGEASFHQWLDMIGFAGEKPNFKNKQPAFSLKEKSLIVLKLLYFSLFKDRLMKIFYLDLDSRLENLFSQLKSKKSSIDIFQLINDELENPPKNAIFGILNDASIMREANKYLRMAKAKTGGNEKILNQLKTNLNLESLAPQQAIDKLKNELSPQYIEKINKNGLISPSEMPQCLQDFLTKYGDRAFDDLKLEAITFNQNLQPLLKLLSIKGSTNTFSPKKLKKRMTKLEKSIFYREKSRLLRSRLIGFFRSAFLKGFEIYTKENQLDLKKEDVFFLRYSYLKKIFDGKVSNAELLRSLEAGKTAYSKRPSNYAGNLALVEDEPFVERRPTLNSDGDLTGIMVSGDSIEGVALVVTHPSQIPVDIDLSDKILITTTTDPAWVYYMAKCRGLISERGGLLSHTAIIGRELGVSTLVNVPKVTLKIKSGMRIRLNSKTQAAEIIQNSIE